MNEAQVLNQSREQLKESFNELTNDLKDYGGALANHIESRLLNFKENMVQKVTTAKGRLGTLKNNLFEKLSPNNMDVKFRNFVENVQIKGLELANKGKEAKENLVDFAAEQIANYYLKQEEKMNKAIERDRIAKEQMQREAAIRANTKEHKKGMKEALRQQTKQEIKSKLLNFKENIVQKVTTLKGRLGQIKNNLLQKLDPNNLDIRFRNMVEQAQIKGLELANEGKEMAINVKDKAVDLVTTQVANYYLKQEEKMNEAIERDRIAKEQMQREAAIRANTKEHKKGMKEALRHQEKEEIKTCFLNFNENIKQKATLAKGKLGTLKNTILQKLDPNNLDLKFRNIVEQAQIKGLELANRGKEVISTVKENVQDFVTQQVDNYYAKKEEKELAKKFREAARIAEMEEIQRIKARKAAMKEAIYNREREMYEQKHIENQQRKEELMNQLLGGIEEEPQFHVARAI